MSWIFKFWVAWACHRGSHSISPPKTRNQICVNTTQRKMRSLFSLLVRGILTCDYLRKILLFRSILMITDILLWTAVMLDSNITARNWKQTHFLNIKICIISLCSKWGNNTENAFIKTLKKINTLFIWIYTLSWSQRTFWHVTVEKHQSKKKLVYITKAVFDLNLPLYTFDRQKSVNISLR